MDYETKLLLNKLVEAVDCPDWWAIGITVVKAFIVAWLGWRQYKLQQRQTELQKQHQVLLIWFILLMINL